ncbi:recombinase family protein [Kitasatospora sp. NPDC057223]|uniref:recombinase family protein n=1 Tax=Kitasatospora sp. NPDC057223 TaxID=3346055 RepID=UPI003633B5A1
MSRRTLPRQSTLRVINDSLRAALYGRASSDPKKRGRSIKDQFEVAELECEDREWPIVGRYEDRDRSASRKARKDREDYQRLVADAEAGLFDVIVYADSSRASRNMRSSLDLRDLCEKTGILLCYGGRVYDMQVASDRKEFTRDALQSEEEAETIIVRAQRTARLNAHRGSPHGRIPFGYTRKYDPESGHLIGQSAHPEHAAVVVDLFERAAARESLDSLTRELRRYVADASRAGLRYLLRNRAYIGVRAHKGQDMAKCTWDAIVEESLFLDVQDVLADPSRRTQRDTRVKHLLSGVGHCSVCLEAGSDEGLLQAKDIGGALRYRCSTGAHVTIREDVLDAAVEAAVFVWLSSEAAVAAFNSRSDGGEAERLRTRIRNMTAQLEAAREQAGQIDDFGVPALSIESLAATERTLIPKVAEDEETLRVLTSAQDPLLARLVGAPIAEVDRVWNEELALAQRRHVLRRVVNIELRRASAPGIQRLEPGRIGLTFVGEAGFQARPQRGAADWVRAK